MKPTKVFTETLKAYRDGFTTIGHKGSARSGKTVGIIQSLDFIAEQSKRHRKISIASQSFPHLRDGAIYEYKKHQMREGIHRQHNKSEHEFYINQSIINYFSCDDPTKTIGPGKDIQYLNEVNNGISFNTFNNLKIRSSEFVIMDWNPAGEFWVHNEKIFEDSKAIIIHSTWQDNIENLSESQIEFFINAYRKSKTSDYWRYWWKVYGMGEDAVLLEERIMPSIQWIKKVPADAIEVPYALDFGFFPDPTAFCRLWVRKGALRDDLYIQEIVYGTKLSINSKSEGTMNLVEYLKTKGVNPKHQCISECADPGAIAEMRGAGFNIEAVKKINVEASIRLFHDYNIHIVDGSKNAFKEFDNYKYKRNKKGVITGVPEDGQADHCIDAVRYILMSRNTRWSLGK